MILYHGTTLSGLKAILSGSGKKVCKPWNRSTDMNMYFYHPDMPQSWEENHPPLTSPVEAAFSYAKIQCCYTDEVDIFVLECEVPDKLVSPDLSFDGAESLYVQVSVKDFQQEYINRVHHKEINLYTKPQIVLGFYGDNSANLDELPYSLLTYVEEVKLNPAKSDTPSDVLVVDFMQTIDHREVNLGLDNTGELSYTPLETTG